MGKLNVLVLGGCGFIGRHLITYLLKNDFASSITVVDKVPPQIAWLNQDHKHTYKNKLVHFRSANLINAESCKNAFSLPDGSTWDLVVNCAGETKSNQTDPVYKEGVLNLSLNCAKQAALQDVGRYIELSSGNMNSCETTPHKEDDPLKPWGCIAKWKLEVEKELANISNLNYTILRLPLVYGVADKNYVMPRILAAGVYKELGKTMKLLWTEDLKIHTVHVEDVCRAIVFVSERTDTLGQIYNVVDDGDTTQGLVSSHLAEIFKINIDYCGTMVSSFIDITGAISDLNDRHLVAWAAACQRDHIQNTPLSPHMDITLLQNNYLNLDGSKLRNLGFELDIPRISQEKLEEIIRDYINMKVFPHSWLL